MLVRRSLGRLAIWKNVQRCQREHTTTLRRWPQQGSSNLGLQPSRRRAFATTACRKQDDTTERSNQDSESGSNETREDATDLEEELLKFQHSGIQRLEQILGKSLEKAVVEDQLAERLLRGQYATDSGIIEDQTEETVDSDALEQLNELRTTSKSPAEVARRARNIFGDYLPRDALDAEEVVLYKRLYGDPLDPEATAKEHRQEKETAAEQNALFNAEGEQIEYELENAEEIAENISHIANRQAPAEQAQEFSPMNLDEAGRAAQIARYIDGDIVDPEEDDTYEDGVSERAHPLTTLGRFATFPRTTFIPKDTFTEPVQRILREFPNKHLRATAEKLFDGPGLPKSPLTPRIGRTKPQVPIPLEAGQRNMSPMEANIFMSAVMPPVYASIQATLVETRKRLGTTWLTKLLAKPEGPRVLDAGSGGAGALVWNEMVDAHWKSIHTSDKRIPNAPHSKMVVLTGSDALRQNVAQFLHNTTFIPRLPDLTNARDRPTLQDDRPAQKRKLFDVIISSHELFPLQEDWQRKQYVESLWSMLSDDGGVLILIEKGVSRGFEAVAGAREMLLDKHIAVPPGHHTFYSKDATSTPDIKEDRVPGMIIAPCTNHERCPLYKVTGTAVGRKDRCSFQQRYIRPPFLQNLLGAKDVNFDDVDFSYVSILKGDDLRGREFSSWDHVTDPLSAPVAQAARKADNAHLQAQSASDIQKGFEAFDPSWSDANVPPPAHLLPRMILPPFKKSGHVTMDLCTPQAEIRRWTIPRSFSRQAYRDARKSQWGDLWALGAKTDTPRNLKVGKPKDTILSASTRSQGPRDRIEKATDQAILDQANEEAEMEREEAAFQRMLEQDNLTDVDEEDKPDEYTIDMETLTPKRVKSKQFTHAKIDGVNVQVAAKSNKMRQRASNDAKKASHSKMAAQHGLDAGDVDFHTGRYGNEDSLSDWSRDYDERMLEDQAKFAIERSGRRATAKNTYRFKRDLRRAKRESGRA